MVSSGVGMMSRPKGRPKREHREDVDLPSTPPLRLTIINLKGTPEQAEWLESTHRETHIAKSVIMRLALKEWGERHGRPPFPLLEGEE